MGKTELDAIVNYPSVECCIGCYGIIVLIEIM